MTALGINNNGELVFPYGREDTDYNIDGDSSSGYVFNGATSVFWCRLRDLLGSEIASTFNTVAAECFSATNLINQFDSFQECYPEEIWRLDIQRKYIRTFSGESIDNSKPKRDVQYLRDMMQGRKKYQRRQWVRDQEVYFNTKYLRTTEDNANRIVFRSYAPVGSDLVLKITPYSDMYVSAMFGNSVDNIRSIRGKGGTEYEIRCPLSSMNDTQVVIYGANRIQALGNLSDFYVSAISFSAASKLRKLLLGSSDVGYTNARLTSLTVAGNELLEELDIRNCTNLSGELNLAQCHNLLRLYAENTKLNSVIFATNGKIQLAHLPSTLNTLTMRNLNNLADFVGSFSNLETLTLEGGTFDNKTFVETYIATLNTLRLYGINWTGANSEPDTDLLNDIASMFFSVLTGSVYVSGPIRNSELATYAAKWGNDLTVTYDPQELVAQHLVTYVNADSQNTVLYTMYVDQGSTPPDPYELGLIEKPTKASDAVYSYSFGEEEGGEYVSGSGWDDLETLVIAPMTVHAVYTQTPRTYTVTWYARSGLALATTQVQYGAEAVYPGDTPTNTTQDSILQFNVFAGWDKSTGFIREDTDVYAVWASSGIPSAGTDLSAMTPAQVNAVVASGNTTNYFENKDYIDITLGHDFDFSNVESELIASNLYLDGSTAVDKPIQLFGENETSFTLAIDFRFNNNTTNGTLLSCFEEDGAEGFRLRYNGGPNVQWGNVNYGFGYQKFRDMLVIRHKKGEDKLYVYASNGTSASSAFDMTIATSQLTRNRSTDTDAILTLGAIRFIADGGHSDYGTGYIHWCKIWYDDLGDANARKLASWPREVLRMEYRGNNIYRLAGGVSTKTNASFICNHLLEGRGQQMETTNTNANGWGDTIGNKTSKMRTFCNTRLYAALPTVWQSMVKKVRLYQTAGNQDTTLVYTEDNVYLPTYNDMVSTSSSPLSDESGAKIPWFVASGSKTENATRCKFRGFKIPDGATYFVTGSDPKADANNTVREGDVWINTSNDSRGYIFVPATKLTQLGITADVAASGGGGWVAATIWWLRSPNVSSSLYFYHVNYNGYAGYYGSASNVYGVCACFSI